MPKRVDLNSVPVTVGSGYPAPFDKPCAARMRQRLGESSGLSDFGVNLLRLPPGTWSSQRHHLQNRSPRDALVLEVGSRKPEDEGEYSDIDMRFGRSGGFTHKDGTPYPRR